MKTVRHWNSITNDCCMGGVRGHRGGQDHSMVKSFCAFEDERSTLSNGGVCFVFKLATMGWKENVCSGCWFAADAEV